MSTKPATSKSTAGAIVGKPLSINELGSLLIRHYDLHVGFFEILVEYQVGMGPIGPSRELTVPGAMIGVSRIGLARARVKSPMTIDAAKENPLPISKRKSPKRG